MIEQLEQLVLDWAKEKMPDAYEKTCNVRTRPNTYMVYLMRLVELRYEQDKGWRPMCPLYILEQTKITQRMTLFGYVIEVQGNKCEGERKWGWLELSDFFKRHQSAEGATVEERNRDLQDATQEFKQLVRVKGDWDCVLEEGKGPKVAALSVASEPVAVQQPGPVPPPAAPIVRTQQQSLL